MDFHGRHRPLSGSNDHLVLAGIARPDGKKIRNGAFKVFKINFDAPLRITVNGKAFIIQKRVVTLDAKARVDDFQPYFYSIRQ